MRQIRLSIGCRDWQEIVRAIGPEAAGILVYLRTLMRSMQASEISITVSELAETMRIPRDRAESALAAISPRYLERTDAGGIITLRSTEEEKQQADARRKRAARLLSRFQGQSTGQSGDTFFDKNGQSADSQKEVYSEVVMYYHPGPGEPRDESSYYFQKKKAKENHALFNHPGQESKKEKAPHTPQKEKSLTETTGRALARTREREPELPADSLEAEFIETIGSWPKSLRDALKAEPEDVREAFYLYIRCKTQDGEKMTADRVRIAWLAARRVPPERRAESILAAAMGGWKTIRDAGSGCYFEKGTGKIVSLVRGPVETSTVNKSEVARDAADLAVQLAQRMRRD